MIFYKTEDEIDRMRESNLLVSRTHAMLAEYIQPGFNTLQLDKLAKEFICDHDAVPGFLNYSGFPNSLCISVNDTVVHGIPSDYCLQDGDIVSIDCGVLKNGYHGDSSFTFEVGEVQPEIIKLLQITRESLYLGIAAAVPGNRIGDVGYAIQQHAEDFGYSVVRELVGHGIGKNLHEKPEVPNYGRKGRGVKLREFMTIAIEPMINMGVKEINQLNDGWTIKTLDGLPSAHFEHTIAIRKEKAELLSNFDIIDEVIKKKKQ